MNPDFSIKFQDTGSSKNNCQPLKYVVNKNGLIRSKTPMLKFDMIVKTINIDMPEMTGTNELPDDAENKKVRPETTHMPSVPKRNAAAKRHKTSSDSRMLMVFISTIISPVSKKSSPTPRLISIRKLTSKKV